MTALNLLLKSIRIDKAGMLSAILGIAAASGLLAWHIGLAMTAIHSGYEIAERAAAPFSAWIGAPSAPGGAPGNADAKNEGLTPEESNNAAAGRKTRRATAEATMGRRLPGMRGGRAIPKALTDAVASAENVARALPLSTVRAVLDMRPGGRVLQGPPFSAVISVLPEGAIPFATGAVEGRIPDQDSAELEAVVNENLFGERVPKPEIGALVPVVLAKGTVTVRITGFFKMSMVVNSFPQMYVNRAAEKAITLANGGRPRGTSLLLVEMREGAEPEELGAVIDKAAELAPESGECPLYTVEAVADRFRSDTVKNLMSQMPMSLAIAVITASCLLSTVLMIGLAVRRRRIALLRCAGMTRSAVVRLILLETLFMLIPGWLLGLAGSAAFLQLFLLGEKAAKSDLPTVIHLGWQTPVYSAVMVLVVGLFATAAPVLASLRVKPLEITGTDISESRPVSCLKAAISVLLLLPLPLLAMNTALPNATKSTLMLLAGLPCFIGSVCLGMHPLMRLVELIFLKPLGLLLRLDSRILERRLSRDPARAAGTVLSISLGLGGFIAVHIWGGTLMSSFVPSEEWPDAIVSVLPSGFTGEQVRAVAGCDGVAGGRVLRIECTQFPIESIRAAGDSSLPASGVLLLFGADAAEAFGGENPLAPMKFIEGDRATAAKLVAEGDYCVIPKMLSNLTGLHKGDSFTAGGRSFEVAGVVDLNWHLVTSRAYVRTRFGGKNAELKGGRGTARTVGMAFVNEKAVRDITGNEDRTYFLWLNMSEQLRERGALEASVRLDAEIRAAVADDGSSAIRVHHRDEVADGTLAHGNDILGTMARIPFWSLIVTSTGIAVLLVASVRGSRKEFESMRAIGMTRGQMARLILGEALLVTLCAIVLSLICGTLIGWSFTGLSNWIMSAGLDVRLIIPWATIGKGVLFALSLCIVMALLPLARLVRMTGIRQ